jgi:FMN-dependent NADH-azoreductase
MISARRAHNAGATVVVRDLARDPVPHLTAERFQAFLTKPEERKALICAPFLACLA